MKRLEVRDKGRVVRTSDGVEQEVSSTSRTDLNINRINSTSGLVVNK